MARLSDGGFLGLRVEQHSKGQFSCLCRYLFCNIGPKIRYPPLNFINYKHTFHCKIFHRYHLGRIVFLKDKGYSNKLRSLKESALTIFIFV